jgi:chromatin remodeling complex protein RSC6
MIMIRYLIYKNKLNNIEDKRFIKIDSKLRTTIDSIEDGIKMPAFCRIKILLKKTSNQNLRRKCDVIKS